MPPKDAGKGAVELLKPSTMETLFPVWNQANIEAEAKAAAGDKYEDPDSMLMPEAIAAFIDSWKRPEELMPGKTFPMVTVKENTEEGAAPAKGKGADVPLIRELIEGCSLAAGSKDVEWLLSTILMIKDSAEEVAQGDFLWELISPKGPDGYPCASPIGKYYVRLFVMDQWRCVTVDDRIPVDLFGQPLVVHTARPLMMWPLLLSKAVFKLMAAFKCKELASPDKVPAYLWLTGWLREEQKLATAGGGLFDSLQKGVSTPGVYNTVMLHTRAEPERPPPRLVVLFGPPAVGRSSIVAKLLEEYPETFGRTVSHTSRPPKEHEEHGAHYFFTSRAELEADVAANKFLESDTNEEGHLYGTSLSTVREVASSGRLPIMTLSLQGVQSLTKASGKAKLDALYVHVVPPSVDDLKTRLEGRLKEAESTFAKRIEYATQTVEEVNGNPDLFDHTLVDDGQEEPLYLKLKETISLLSPIIRNRLRGLPAYVLDYADVIPSNSVEKMHLKPVVITGPALLKSQLIARLVEEFPEVFAKVQVHTTREPLEGEADSDEVKFCSAEEMEELKGSGKFAVSQQDLFCHSSLVKTHAIEHAAIEKALSQDKLCVLDLEVEAAKALRAGGMDAMLIFIAPDSIDAYTDRLRFSLKCTPEQIDARVAQSSKDMEAAKEFTDVTLENGDLDLAYANLKKVITEFRPDVLGEPAVEVKCPIKPLAVSGAPHTNPAEIVEKLVAEFPDSFSVPLEATTRPMEKGEVPGETADFFSEEEFQALIDEGKVICYATDANGMKSGFTNQSVERVATEGKVAVLQLTPEQNAGLKSNDFVGGCLSVMIEPPPKEDFRVLLANANADPGRTTPAEPDEATDKMVEEAFAFLDALKEGPDTYDVRIMNDVVEDAYILLKEAIYERYKKFVTPFLTPLVVASPSGSGKKTMVKELFLEFPEKFEFALSHTTRPLEEGSDKTFVHVSEEEFQALVTRSKFAEHTQVQGNCHGMTWSMIKKVQSKGKMCIIDGDVAAAKALKEAGLKATYVFVNPPPEDIYLARLRERKETEENIRKWVKLAAEEVEAAGKVGETFDFIVENNNANAAEEAYVRLKEAIATRSPETVPMHSVWGFGRHLWDTSKRVYGRKPMHIMVLGPALSGKTTLCHKLTEDFGVPHISTGALLREAAYDLTTELGLQAKVYLDSSKKVPDDFLIQLVKDRVAMEDCVKFGWVLDGFPRTTAQAEALYSAGVVPDKVMFLECPHTALFERAEGRRLDPSTGKVYHETLQPPAEHEEVESITGRWTIRHDDTADNVRARLQHYDNNYPGCKQSYPLTSVYIDAHREVGEVYADLLLFLKLEDHHLAPNDIVVTDVSTLSALEYCIADTKKLKLQCLIKLRDLLAVEESSVWVDLNELMKVSSNILKNFRPQNYEHTFAVTHNDRANVAPLQLLRVDSKEPTDVLVSLLLAPPEQLPGADAKRPILVLSGPSGTGKSTLIKMLMEEYKDMFEFSVSSTTRAPREGEEAGVHYNFLEVEQMKADIEEGKFLEHAEVHGNFYGTSKEAVEKVQEGGKVCVLDIDVQGAKKVKESGVEALFVFVCPPSMEECEKRLRGRGTDSEETILKRLKNAASEMAVAREPAFFDRVIINDGLDAAYAALKETVLTDFERNTARSCRMLLESYQWEASVPGEMVCQLQTTTACSEVLQLPRGHHVLRPLVDRKFFYSVALRSTTPILVQPAAQLLSEHEKVQTYEASGEYPEMQAGIWGLWLRVSFACTEDARVAATFGISDDDAVQHMRLILIDNDTGDFTPYALGRVTADLAKNTEGYSILVYARPPRNLEAGNWSLVLAADKALEGFASVPLTAPQVFSGPYKPNKNGVLCRYTVSAAEAQQLSLHMETKVDCAFTVTLRKPVPPPEDADPAALLLKEPEEEVVKTWTVQRILCAPVVLSEKLEAATYMVDVRIESDLCAFDMEHNGDIPMPLEWTLVVASDKTVEVVEDDSQEKRFTAILEGWNMADPKGRPEAAEAALQRMQAEKEEGKKAFPTSRTLPSEKEIPLDPPRFHILRSTGTDVLLQEADYENRNSNLTAMIEEETTSFQARIEARDGAHEERTSLGDKRREEFISWREGVTTSHLDHLGKRDEYVALAKALADLEGPSGEEEEAPAEGEELSEDEKALAADKKALGRVLTLLQDLKSSALAEIKSYNHPPKSTLAVMQSVMFMLGKASKEVNEWNKLRLQITPELVQKLVEFDPEAPRNVKKWKQAGACLDGLDEAQIVKESIAAAVIFKWILATRKVSDTAVAARQAAEAAAEAAAAEAPAE